MVGKLRKSSLWQRVFWGSVEGLMLVGQLYDPFLSHFFKKLRTATTTPFPEKANSKRLICIWAQRSRTEVTDSRLPYSFHERKKQTKHISSRKIIGNGLTPDKIWLNFLHAFFKYSEKNPVLVYYSYWCYHQQCNLYFLFKRKINHFAINFSIINFHCLICHLPYNEAWP